MINIGSLKLDIAANQLINGDEVTKVEPRLVGVLAYLYEHQNSVVTRESLINEVWQGQVISDNAISRSISQLRKMLSSSNNPIPTIETIPKVGYRLLLDVSSVNLTGERKSTSTKDKQKKSASRGFDVASLKIVLFAVFTAMIFISYLSETFLNEPKQISFIQSRLTNTPGIERLAKFSPDNQAVLFAHSNQDSNGDLLRLANPLNRKSTLLTSTGKLILNVAWSPDSKKIVYSYWKNNHNRKCGINLITLDKDKKLVTNNKIMDCSERSRVYLAWDRTGEKIYFNTRESFDRPYSIFSYSLTSKRKSQLTLPPQQSNLRGDYYLVGNSDGSRLAVARYLGTHRIELEVHDTSSQQVISSNIISDPISSATWFGLEDKLLLSIDNNLFSYQHMNNVKTLFYAIGKNSGELNTDSDGTRILFTQSNSDINLIAFDLSNGQEIERVVATTSAEYMPSFANKTNRIAYLSDQSGKSQIWLKDEGSLDVQVSDSPVAIGLTPLKWSPDDSLILFQHEDEIYSIDVVTNQISKQINLTHKPAVANWSADGQSIFYSSEKSGEWQIWEYLLLEDKHKQITLEGGYSAYQQANGNLLVSRIHQKGVWLLQVDNGSNSGYSKAKQLLKDFDGTNWVSWQLDDGNLYYVSAGEHGEGLVAYNIRSKRHRLIIPFGRRHLRYFAVKEGKVILSILENRESNIEMLVSEK